MTPGDSRVGDDYNLPHWINHRQENLTDENTEQSNMTAETSEAASSLKMSTLATCHMSIEGLCGIS